jgi:hypothetical protein
MPPVPNDPRRIRRRRPRPPPVCPECGRPVHRVPTGPGGERLLTLAATVGGWTLAAHRCPPPGTPPYPVRPAAERRWTIRDAVRMFPTPRGDS